MELRNTSVGCVDKLADWLLGHETEINETLVLGTKHRLL